MIVVLAIAALSVTMTTGTNVQEFSEDALQVSRSVFPRRPIPAEFINPSTKITLQRRQDYLCRGITLVPEASPNAPLGVTVPTHHTSKKQKGEGSTVFNCGQLHGISLKTEGSEKTACNILEINMIAGSKDSDGITVNTFRFSILFQHGGLDSLRLDVPVLQLPSAFKAFQVSDNNVDKEDIITWAVANKVGIFTPFTDRTLKDILAGRSISFDFQWLRQLLQLGGVCKLSDFGGSSFPPAIETYVTRPLVLPRMLVSKYLEVVEKIDNTDENIQKVIDGISETQLQDYENFIK